MGRLRIAFATNDKKGLEDSVSKVFGRAQTFTILDAEGEKITELRVLDNPGKTYQHGAGPLAVKMLLDAGVEVVIAYELGVGASELLKQHDIEHVSIKPNTKVREALRIAISKLEKAGLLAET
jgi:predicted Fe-Mo cluster-binding NifX family protein